MKSLRSKNIVLIVGGNYVNKGANLMIDTVLHILQVWNPQLKPVIIDSFPTKQCINNYRGVKVLSVHYVINFMYAIVNGMCLSPEFIYKTFRIFISRTLRVHAFKDIKNAIDMFRLLNKVYCVIDIHGYGYKLKGDSSDFMNYVQLFFAKIAQYKQTPYLYFSQSFGGFNIAFKGYWNIKLLNQIKEALSGATQIFFREQISKYEVYNIMSLEKGVYWPDIALLYAPHFRHRLPPNLLSDVNEKRLRQSILIIPNVRLYDKYSTKIVDTFYKSLIFNIEKYNFNAIVMRHSGDDLKIINKLKKWFPHIAFLDDEYTTEQINIIIALSGFVISGRYHGLIISLKNNIPCAAIGWAHKYDELMNLFKLEKFLINILEENSDELIVKNIVAVMESREEVVSQIENINKRLLRFYSLSRFISLFQLTS